MTEPAEPYSSPTGNPSEHWDDMAPELVPGTPERYGALMQGPGRWFFVDGGWLVWTDDDDGLSVISYAGTDPEVTAEFWHAIEDARARGVPARLEFDILRDQYQPGIYESGDLAALLERVLG